VETIIPSNTKVHIALASYYGAAYISEQLDSIRAQTHKQWRLLIRDDGSSDGTVEIVRALESSDPRVTLLTGGRKSLGPGGNFAHIMQSAYDEGAEYLMLADQDDAWREDKIALQLEAMKLAESRHGATTPLLVYSDLAVTDDNMRPVSESFMRHQGIRHESEDPMKTLLAQNFVTGCASMVNRSLLRMALPVPVDAIMHDWWLALVAAAAGRIEYLPEPLVRYRQHGNNVVGVKRFRDAINPMVASQRWAEGRFYTIMTFEQAKSLAKRLRELDRPTPLETMDLIEEFSRLPELSRLKRITTIRRMGIRKQSLSRQLLMYLRLILT